LPVPRRLSTVERPEGVNAIARSTGMSPNSCFNILKTLTAQGGDLGSGLIDQSQKMTVAAMQMADMKVCAQRS
jgi:phage baseplate assembly protein gpV